LRGTGRTIVGAAGIRAGAVPGPRGVGAEALLICDCMTVLPEFLREWPLPPIEKTVAFSARLAACPKKCGLRTKSLEIIVLRCSSRSVKLRRERTPESRRWPAGGPDKDQDAVVDVLVPGSTFPFQRPQARRYNEKGRLARPLSI